MIDCAVHRHSRPLLRGPLRESHTRLGVRRGPARTARAEPKMRCRRRAPIDDSACRTARFGANPGRANRAVRAATPGKMRVSKNRTFSEPRGSRPLCPGRHRPAAAARFGANPGRTNRAVRAATPGKMRVSKIRTFSESRGSRLLCPQRHRPASGAPGSRVACDSVQNPRRRTVRFRPQSQETCGALETLWFSNRAIRGPADRRRRPRRPAGRGNAGPAPRNAPCRELSRGFQAQGRIMSCRIGRMAVDCRPRKSARGGAAAPAARQTVPPQGDKP